MTSKVKEEENKKEGGDAEPDDFEKDERKTYVVELFIVCFDPTLTIHCQNGNLLKVT